MEIGTKLGAYEVIAKLGAGGMGEVYRARDLRLDREVAIKVLPASFARDADRVKRFEREAKTLAALNHPHIAQIYGLERTADESALVMELVEGDDLAARIARGPIAPDDAFLIARQIAEALEAAHEAGIVHRDLKPANIKVRLDGTVKVLDFGLAKSGGAGEAGRAGGASVDGGQNLPTITSPAMTQQGMLLGTAAYMAPEQARGKAIDRRADIWAFGVVLYEMLTGQRAFAGDNVSETLASVMRDTPPLDRLPPATPAHVRVLLGRCLDREPRTRLRDIGEARVALSSSDTPAAVREAPRRGTLVRTLSMGLAGAALGVLVMMLIGRRDDASPPPAFRVLPITVDGLDVDNDTAPVISPDGQRIVYSAHRSLWIRDLGRVDAQAIPETEGAAGMFWSADSTRIGFIRAGRLWTLALGGTAASIAVLPFAPCGEIGTVWRTDGRILLSLSCALSPVFSVADTGGDLTPALQAERPAERDFHQMTLLPTQTVVLTLDRADTGADTLVAWDGTTRKTLLQLPNERLASPAYSPTGHLLYQRTTTNPGVWAVPFSAERLEVTGDPFLVAPEMAAPAVARDGTLVVVPMSATGSNQLVWIDRAGRIAARIDDEHARPNQPRLSPDARRVAYTDDRRTLWIHNLAEGTRTQMASGPALKWFPFWSPDGKYLYYAVEQPGRGARLERQPSTGGGTAETIVEGARAGTISGDGRWLVYAAGYTDSGRRLFKIRLDGDRAPSVLFDTPHRATEPALSPDHRYIAYALTESPADDGIYVRRFPEGDGQWRLDAAAGYHPRWSAKGDRLYFARENGIWEIDVTLGDVPSFGRARRLFGGYDNRSWPSAYGFDVAADGRFLLVANRLQSVAPVMTVIENWQLGSVNRR